jgi:nucleotide-binding universal stress UspA family protein
MNLIKRILVGMDLTELDAQIVSYVSVLAKFLNADVIYFFHVARKLELPKDILSKYPDLVAPMDEAIKKEMQHTLAEHFKCPEGCEYHVSVKEGLPSEELMRWGKIKNIDLVVMGKKSTLPGSGSLPRKIALTAPYSILFVTENPNENIQKILVPVDFSEHSKMALEEALSIATASNGKVYCQNIHSVPIGYSKIGKTYVEFAEIMKGHAQNDMAEFLKPYENSQVKIETEFTLDDDEKASDKIFAYAKSKAVDLIIVGSKGRTNAASVLMGSTAERLLALDNSIPFLIMKKRNENLGFFEALFKL